MEKRSTRTDIGGGLFKKSSCGPKERSDLARDDTETFEPMAWRNRNESATGWLRLDRLVATRLMTDERLVRMHQSLARQRVESA